MVLILSDERAISWLFRLSATRQHEVNYHCANYWDKPDERKLR